MFPPIAFSACKAMDYYFLFLKSKELLMLPVKPAKQLHLTTTDAQEGVIFNSFKASQSSPGRLVLQDVKSCIC
jgi:hypothetical protein